MSSFSICPNVQVDVVDQYTDYLEKEVNNGICGISEADIHNPVLLQQLGVLRATRIQRATETNGAILYHGLRYTNDTIRSSSSKIAKKIGKLAPMITSSLDRGFEAMHYSLGTINDGVTQVNNNLGQINSTLGVVNENIKQTNNNIINLTAATERGMRVLHQEQKITNQHLQNISQSMHVANAQLQNIHQSIGALTKSIGQGFSLLQVRLDATNALLQSVLNELRIPETQRERRYYIEEGSKYLAMALSENDRYYYEDAIAEFEKAIKLEPKDYYSWFALGFIYLRSIYHIDIQKSIESLNRFVHYARAEAIQRNNQSLKFKLDEAYLLMAEAKYLLKNPMEAIQLTERCVSNKEKALFMKVKYLSFIGDKFSKQRAADELEALLRQNPFLSLQVLEDADIINNEYVELKLVQLKNEVITEAKTKLDKIKYEAYKLATKGYWKLVDYLNSNKIETLISKKSYLEAYEALYLLEKLYDDDFFRITKLLPKMIKVEDGCDYFFMGAQSRDRNGLNYDSDAIEDETPVQMVKLDDYYIGETLVTQELWQAVMGSNPSCFKGSKLPVENVSWDDCQEFIKKLNAITGKTFRLPTEAEWEYAARGGNKSKGYKYSGSNNIDDVAWYDGNSSGKTHEVGTKAPNELGLYDMSGNVWEWCSDWYGAYSSSTQTNPKGPTTGSFCVLRGGSWFNRAKSCRVSIRGSWTPRYRDSNRGLRLVCSCL